VYVEAALESTPEAFRNLGTLLDRRENGERLARFCEHALALKNAVMAKVNAVNARVSVLYCLDSGGLYVMSRGTYHSEVLDEIADNRAVMANPSSRGSGNEVGFEQILLWNPEVLLIQDKNVYESLADDSAWAQMAAVKNKRYYHVPVGPYNWMGGPPSNNRYLGMLWMLKILYPQYADFDLYAEIMEYYRLFYHHELTEQEYKELTDGSI
jgi:iron complex transport system substrate-binding protein